MWYITTNNPVIVVKTERNSNLFSGMFQYTFSDLSPQTFDLQIVISQCCIPVLKWRDSLHVSPHSV